MLRHLHNCDPGPQRAAASLSMPPRAPRIISPTRETAEGLMETAATETTDEVSTVRRSSNVDFVTIVYKDITSIQSL